MLHKCHIASTNSDFSHLIAGLILYVLAAGAVCEGDCSGFMPRHSKIIFGYVVRSMQPVVLL
jgi:hypothetical protein